MHALDQLFDAAPLLALFLTISLGYLVGKFKVGRFVLGGIAGTLLVGVVIGQLGIDLDAGIKNIFFALFIYAVGFQGGPQFFHALNRRSLNQLASAFLMTVTGLFCVLAAAWMFGLDRGTAAGLAAGGLTQSAIIGTAGGAIAKLDVAAELKQVMETNVAVGYAITYIFGSLGPIIMVTWFFPTIMRWNIREEAIKLAKTMSGGHPSLEPGQFNALKRVVTRVYRLSEGCKAVGKTAEQADALLDDAAFEGAFRDGKPIEPSEPLKAGDDVAVTGLLQRMTSMDEILGHEVEAPDGFQVVEENREIVLTNRDANDKTVGEIHDRIAAKARRGVFLTGIRRMGHDLPLSRNVALKTGDELSLTGSAADLNRVQSHIGYKITAAGITDFVFFGLGMAVGVLLGLIQFKIAGVPVSIGTGGGCLLSGLFFGWLRSTHPRFAALPMGASNFLRDFGLAVFVGAVGITAGPQALVAIKQFGPLLFLLGIGVTLIPQVIVFYISYYLLRIKNPIEVLACVVGGRSANPGFAALMGKAGNATPVVAFTVCYAVANVFLTLWGPIIIGVITKNPAP